MNRDADRDNEGGAYEVDAVTSNPPFSELPFYTPAEIAKVVARELAKDGAEVLEP